MRSMEGPAPPPQAADRLRWLHLLPVIAFTALGIVLVFAVLVGLARGSRGFYRANLETISLSAALAAPICEEVFFRGMLFRLLWTRVPLWAAVLLSAIAFGLAHASPAVSAALLPTFMYMGTVLAVIYVRTGWLTNTILLHGLSNAIATVLVFYQASS